MTNHTTKQLSLLTNDPGAKSNKREKPSPKAKPGSELKQYEGYSLTDHVREILKDGGGIKEVEIYVSGGL